VSDEIKTESVYERARRAVAVSDLNIDRFAVYDALAAGEAAEKRAEEAEAQIAAMHEAVREAEHRPPDQWCVFTVLGPDGKPLAIPPSQASGFYHAIRMQWSSGFVGRLSREFRDARERAEAAERERDEERARADRLEEALKAIVEHEKHDGCGCACVQSVARAALDPPKEG
jgi:hypothetical protein